jgi:mannose-6-phosphate isomerase
MEPTETYPLRFNTIYIEKPWGGRTLERFKGPLPDGQIGETWDVSAQPDGISVVANGHLAGLGLDEVVQRRGRALLGSVPESQLFPLMVRHVSSREHLSVQVHPTTAFATADGQCFGKDEAWYVLDAEDDAFVYAGVSGISDEEFRAAVHSGSVRDHLVKRKVRAGDCIYIPAGTIHAICKGVTLIEICENSNTTYRVFDYGRNRGLDFEETFANMDLKAHAQPRRGLTISREGGRERVLCLAPTMGISELSVNGKMTLETRGQSFHTLTCVDGAGVIEWSADKNRQSIQRGESVLVPADLGEYCLVGALTVVRSWVPDVDKESMVLLREVA